MTAKPEHDNLAAALAAFQAELPAVHKGAKGQVPGKREHKYADLADLSAAVLPVLGKHGLSWITSPDLDESGRFVLRYELLHSSGQSRTGAYPLPHGTAWEVGSAITYARRYTLSAVVGVAADEDDDGAAAQDAGPAVQDRGNGHGRVRPNGGGNGGQRGNQAPAPTRTAEEPARVLLGAETQERVERVAGKVEENGDGELDATPYITQDDRDALGDRIDTKVSLDDLCAAVLGYWQMHGVGPRMEREPVGAASGA